MSTEIEILAATEQDAKDFAQLTIVSNTQDRLFIYVCPCERNATLTQQSEHLRWRTERVRNRMQTAGTHWFRAVDKQTGRTVGVTGVIAPHCDKSGWANELSEAIDEEAFMECGQMISQKTKELLGDRKNVWYLASTAVHPDFQGQGIGRKLLDAICSLADNSSQGMYLEASPAGLKLYQKTGFESLGNTTLFEGGYSWTFMLRKPGLAA